MFILNHWYIARKIHKTVIPHLINLKYNPGTLWDNIKPDTIKKSHGFDCQKKTGNIIDYIDTMYSTIKYNYSVGKSNDKNIQFLIHYITDAMTIGQISGKEFFGLKDDVIDLLSDLKIHKLEEGAILHCYALQDYSYFKAMLLGNIHEVYNQWIDYFRQAFKRKYRLFYPGLSRYTQYSIRCAINMGCIALMTIDRELTNV